MNVRHITTPAATAVALLIAACGGGGGGISGTGTVVDVSYGSVTNKGSVWVNGVEYETVTAKVLIDGQTLTGDDSVVKVGMVVQVDGSIAKKEAATVTVEGSLKGRVEAVLDANRIVVMGQTVQVDDRTRYEGNLRPALGDRVEVHGLVVGSGVLAGGYIAVKTVAPNPPFAVKGLVSGHDPANNVFTVGNLLVRYAGATVSDLGSGSWNGQLVEVKGTACAGALVCGTLTASKVEAGGVKVDGSTPVKAEVEGYVRTVSATGFTVGTQAVTTSASTVFEGGVLDEILVGTQLEVEGTVRSGVLQASKVQFRENVRLEGNVASRIGNVVTLTGLPGVTVGTNVLTDLDKIDAIADLNVGDHLRIRGRSSGAAAMVATRLELRSDDNRTILQAPVTTFADPTLRLLGVLVNTSTVPNVNFFGLDDASIGRSAFFAALRTGALVKARGELNGASVTWSEMELED